MASRIKERFHALSTTGKVTTIAIGLLLAFGTVGALAQPSTDTGTKPATVKSTSPSPTPKIEIKTISTTESIPFTSTTIQDGTLDQGTTVTRTKGVSGVLTHTYQVTYKDGVETSRSAPKDTITIPAINEVIAQGTKVLAPSCPNGTYVNSAGNTVCSPYTSNSAPVGATARCGDGTYSFSQSRRGTCSHHGGVASWL